MSEKPPMNVKQEADTVTITVKLFKNPYPSSTGKSIILYTSKGFQWHNGIGIWGNIMSSKWYIVTVKLKGKAKTKEDARERCKLLLRYRAGLREENIEIVNVEEDRS